MFSESTLTGCFSDDWAANVFWTAGQRTDPTRESTFIWRVQSNNACDETVFPMTYTNWDSGEPNYAVQRESCVNLYSGDAYKWYDAHYDIVMCSVCEFDM